MWSPRLRPRPLRPLVAQVAEKAAICFVAPSLTCRALGEVRRSSATPPRSFGRASHLTLFEQPAGAASCAWRAWSLRSHPNHFIL